MGQKRKFEDPDEPVSQRIPKNRDDPDTTIHFRYKKISLSSGDLKSHLGYFRQWTSQWPSTIGLIDGKLMPVPSGAPPEVASVRLEEDLVLLFDLLLQSTTLRGTQLWQLEEVARLAHEYGATESFRQSIMHRIMASSCHRYLESDANVFLNIANFLQDEKMFKSVLRTIVAQWRKFKRRIKGSPLYDFCDDQYDIFMDQCNNCLVNMLNAYDGRTLSGSAVAGQLCKLLANAFQGEKSAIIKLTTISPEQLMSPISNARKAVEKAMDAGHEACNKLSKAPEDRDYDGDNDTDGGSENDEVDEQLADIEFAIDSSAWYIEAHSYGPEIENMARRVREALDEITDRRYPGMFIPKAYDNLAPPWVKATSIS